MGEPVREGLLDRPVELASLGADAQGRCGVPERVLRVGANMAEQDVADSVQQEVAPDR